VYAQAPDTYIGVPLVSLYDLDATSYTYCRTLGVNGDVFGAWKQGPSKVVTSGSSTTVTSVTAGGSGAFNGVAAGDEIRIISSTGTITSRVVTARASADSITIDAAVDLTTPAAGTQFWYRTLECGTETISGWFSTSPYQDLKITWEMNQVSLTSGYIDFRVECRDFGVDNQPVQVWGVGASGYPAAGFVTAGILLGRKAIYIPESWYECRVGSIIVGTDDGADTGANAEKITIKVSGRPRSTVVR
jgi:hypothetical protein